MKNKTILFAAVMGTLVWACGSDSDKQQSATTSGGAGATATGGKNASGGNTSTTAAGGSAGTGGAATGGAAMTGGSTGMGTMAMGGMTTGGIGTASGGTGMTGGSTGMGTMAMGGMMMSTGGIGSTLATGGTATNVGGSTSLGGSSSMGTGHQLLEISVAPGDVSGTAVVNVTASESSDAGAITQYSVTAEPGAATATSAVMPLTVTGLATQTNYTFTIVAHYEDGSTVSATTGELGFYDVVETFNESMTQPNNTIFTGAFTYDFTADAVSNLAGTLTESMTKVNGVYGSPMTTVALSHQLSAVGTNLGDVNGLLVTTFALTTTDTFTGGGFAPGGTQYYGLQEGTPNNHNAYAMIFVNTQDPTAALAQAQIDKLAYADCTAGGMMMSSCMTGTTVAGYGRTGTMGGYPTSEVITRR
jgi:hypothetical protein